MARVSVKDFLDRFVRPLVAGGELHVGGPIPAPDVERWDTELHDATVELVAVDDARHAVLSSGKKIHRARAEKPNPLRRGDRGGRRESLPHGTIVRAA